MQSAEQEFVALMDKFRKLRSIEKIIDSDLSFAEIVILDQIMNSDMDITVSNLSEALKITKAAVSRIVTSIEQKGYIKREDDEKDKRITHIFITPKGHEMVTKTFECMEKLSQYISLKMGEEDLIQLISLMNKLYAILEEKKERGKTDV